LFSQYEAFGLVYFEAMAHGLPVLTHDVGANGELLVKGAVVTPRFDQVAAVGELVRLVNDDDYRESMSKDAREYAVNEFTWPAVAGKYLEVYSVSEL
jgi:glycosyltransferase involved in cell wall biosynthesis